MEVISEKLLTRYLRCQCGIFTIDDVTEYFSSFGFKEKSVNIENYIQMCPYVYALDGGGYISKAGLFTEALFSIKPSKMEIQKGILIPGHRCIPFMDAEMPSGLVKFVYNGKMLNHKTITLPLQEALSYFSLYGEEYAIQYVMGDPANSSLEIRYDCEFPSHVNLTVTDFSQVYAECDFGSSDTFLASVLDWDNSTVSVQPVISDKNNPFDQNPLDKRREDWYLDLEKALCKSFEIFGPCFSIDEQITRAYFLDFKKLSVATCGTLEQFIRDTKKIGFEPYGVESRLWFKGQEVPAIGAWLKNNTENDFSYEPPAEETEPYPVFESVLDSWIMNQFFSKKEDEEELIENLYPENYILSEKELKDIKKKIFSRKNYLKKRYNWFSDFDAGNIRYKVLILHRKIISLVYEIDSAKIDLRGMPQKPLVILTQLLNHSRFMLETLLDEDGLGSVEISNYVGSLEGMEYSLDEVSAELRQSLAKLIKTKFSMFKNN